MPVCFFPSSTHLSRTDWTFGRPPELVSECFAIGLAIECAVRSCKVVEPLLSIQFCFEIDVIERTKGLWFTALAMVAFAIAVLGIPASG